MNATQGGGSGSLGLGWTINGQRIDLGSFISAIVYFVIFMAVIYFVLVVPYRAFMKKRGNTVFGPPAETKTCRSASPMTCLWLPSNAVTVRAQSPQRAE